MSLTLDPVTPLETPVRVVQKPLKVSEDPSGDTESLVDVEKIRLDGGTQPREALNDKLIEDYAESMQAGEEFPAVEVYFDGSDYWLADGFHRVRAAKRINRKKINAKVHQGTQREALKHSLRANAEHGLRRTNNDKRRAVELALKDPEWKLYSDHEIARMCRVTQPYVSKVSKQLYGEDAIGRTRTSKDEPDVRKGVKQDGSVTRITTQNIVGRTYVGGGGTSTEVEADQTDETLPAAIAPPAPAPAPAPSNIVGVIPAGQVAKSSNLYKFPKRGDEWRYGRNTLKYAELPKNAKELGEYRMIIIWFDFIDNRWNLDWLADCADIVVLVIADVSDIWEASAEVGMTYNYATIALDGDYANYFGFFTDEAIDALEKDSLKESPEQFLRALFLLYLEADEECLIVNPQWTIGEAASNAERGRYTILLTNPEQIRKELSSWENTFGQPIYKI